MQDWQKFFKILSCACGQFTIMELETCLSDPGKDKWGHFLTREHAAEHAEKLYFHVLLEKELADEK